MIPQKFNAVGNIALILGSPSGGLIEVDLDCQEARQVASVFLPPTPMVSGRASNPCSHLWYIGEPTPRLLQCRDPLKPKDEAMIIELRSDPKRTAEGLQTVVPTSIHPTGEAIRWENPDDLNPPNLPGPELTKAVTYIGLATLISRYWPEHGEHGHEVVMALSGAWLRDGVTNAEVKKIVLATAGLAGYSRARAPDVDDTEKKLHATEQVTGWTRFTALLQEELKDRYGPDATKKLVNEMRKWLREAGFPSQSPINTEVDTEPPNPTAVLQTEGVPEFSSAILEGSYIGELAKALLAGTALAPQLASSAPAST